MIVALCGVTGIGKSFFKNLLVSELGFKNMIINTTRKIRQGEVNGIDKIFLGEEEFEDLKEDGKIASDFEFLGFKYAYSVEDLNSDENLVTEVHYSTIFDFKKNAKNVFAIYMVPNDIERAKTELKKRNLPKKIESQRLKEIDEHVKSFSSAKELQNQFDYIFINNYNEQSIEKMLEIIKNKLELAGENDGIIRCC